MKKLLAVLLSMCLILSGRTIYALDTDASRTDGVSYYYDLIAEVLEDNDLCISDCTIIPLNENSISKNTSEYAIQAVTTNGNQKIVTTIIPWKLLDDGELVNSFTVYDDLKSQKVNVNFHDLKIVTYAYYSQYYRNDNFWSFYRAEGIDAYWTSSNSTVTVSYMHLNYDAAGEAYLYPTCTTCSEASLSNYLINSSYYLSAAISKTSPSKGVTYSDYSNVMPYNVVLHCTNYYNHGGMVNITAIFTQNGTTYNVSDNFTVFGT